MLSFLKDPLVKRFIFLPGLVVFAGLSVFGMSGLAQVELFEMAVVEQQAQTDNANRYLQKVQFLRNQESLYQQYGDQYETLMQKGMVKDLDRVLWVDGLLKIKQQLQLAPMVIMINAEVLLESTDLKEFMIKNDIFYSTRINMSFGLQADTDLFRMLNLISSDISPHYFVEKCKLDQSFERSKNIEFNPLSGNIAGECSLIIFQSKPRLLQVDIDL